MILTIIAYWVGFFLEKNIPIEFALISGTLECIGWGLVWLIIKENKMALFIINKCEKHNQKEEMVIYFDKKQNAYGCFPTCRKCMEEDKNYIIYNSWKEACEHKKE